MLLNILMIVLLWKNLHKWHLIYVKNTHYMQKENNYEYFV